MDGLTNSGLTKRMSMERVKLMKVIHSPRFGQLHYEEEQVITFPQGLPGFETFTRYVLLPLDEQDEQPFYFLQSVEEGDLSFLVLNPLRFFPDYEVELSDAVVDKLQIEKPEDVSLFTTVTVRGALEEATTNLKAPLVINVPKRLGKQVVVENKDYLIKQPLFVSHNEQVSVGQKG